MSRSKRLVLLATSVTTQGGIAAVIAAYRQAGLFERWPVVHIPTHCDGTPWRKLRLAARGWCRFVWLLLSGRVALVHVHSASNASFWRKFMFIVVAYAGRIPVIFHLHGGGFLEFYDKRRGSMRRAMIRFVLNRAAEIIVLSETWQRDIRRLTRNPNITSITNPIIVPACAAEPTDRGGDTVLYLGRLVEGKGLLELVDSMSAVLASRPQAKLQFAGVGELEAPIRRRVMERGIADRAEFLGWISGDAKWRTLAAADIYVLPSDAEGLPMGVLEAMAMGLPIVASRVGGIPDLVEHGRNGYLLTFGDVTGLTAALSALLGDRELARRMGDESRRRFTARFAAERVIPQVEAVYARVLAGSAAQGLPIAVRKK